MATLCIHCGTTLKGDVCFCSGCGASVPLQPPRLQSTSLGGQYDNRSVVMHEQIAQQPSSGSALSSVQSERPAWMNQLDNGFRDKSKIPSTRPPTNRQTTSPEITHGDWLEQPREHEKRKPITETPTIMWPIDSFENVPTQQLATDPPKLPRQQSLPSLPVSQEQATRFDRVEYLDTVPLPARMERRSPAPKKRKSRKPLVIVLVILLLLVSVGGIGAWVVLRQPFSVPSVTQPLQSFKDAQLGFSLAYPSSWVSQVDRGKASVYFSDSSHTGQVNIVVGSDNGGDLNHSLQQEASQLGMTAQKTGTPRSFAGTTWQQLQGTVLQKGASYTETLLVTVHNQHLFTLMLLAPQTTYTQEDQLIFSAMRSSFQFLA